MNLIICLTPLQVLIAERIIAEHPREQFVGIFYSRSDSPRERLYYERLRKLCVSTKYLRAFDSVAKEGAWWKWKPRELKLFARTLIQGLCLPKFDKVFCASLHMPSSCTLLIQQRKAALYTYDDGTLNLSLQLFDYLINCYPPPLSIRWNQVFGTTRWRIPSSKELLARIVKHYTIYNLPNALPRAELISLYKSELAQNDVVPTSQVSIFIAQDLYFLDDDREQTSLELARKVLERFDITEIYPHPKWNPFAGDKRILSSPLCFEDYILQRIVAEPDTHFTLYTFCSSAMLNLSMLQLPNVSLVALHPDDTPEYIEEPYAAFRASGISVVEIKGTRGAKYANK